MSNLLSDVVLLLSILPVLFEVACFYTGRDERAIKTRRTINRSESYKKPFHANIWADLRSLVTTLASVVTKQADLSQDFLRSATSLVQVIEEDIVKVSSSDDIDQENSADDDREPYARTRRLLELIQTRTDQLHPDEKVEWLCERINFRRPGPLAQRRIIDHVRGCYQKVCGLVNKAFNSVEAQTERARLPVWYGAKPLCDAMETLHARLEASWRCSCGCSPLHTEAKFTFDPSQQKERQLLRCSMIYQSSESPDKWQHARLEFDRSHGPGMHGFGDLCQDLEVTKTSVSGPKDGRASHIVSYHGDCEEPSLLESSLDSQQMTNIAALKTKERLLLALYLSYLFLHLSGGPWWPYHATSGVIWIWASNNSTRPLIFSPLLTASLHRQLLPARVPATVRSANPKMSSLPILGKMLLSIAMGREIDWTDLDTAIEEYRSNDEAFAEELLGAVESCLGTDDLTFKTGGLLREDESMRLAFMQRVVKKLQYILSVGYNEDINRAIDQASAETQKLTDDLLAIPMQARHEKPGKRNPAAAKDKQCLHDDGAVETVELLSEGESASRHRPAIAVHTPVRIAVIDTGVHIDEDTLNLKYDGLLKECRSWLEDANGDAGQMMLSPADSVGHGTHATSLLLQATQHTPCEVYAAQALKYAITVWKVDIISMSFGYQNAIPAIEEVIDDNARKVIMFAAASNCGGNAPISWPARHPNVICVFATDAYGNFYRQNPTPQEGTNLAVLGTSVGGCWPPALNESGNLQHKSGTSCATPIAAGIAGVVMNLMRARKSAYLESLPTVSKLWNEKKKLKYERHLHTLGKPWGMKAVLRLMTEKRQGYDSIAPWRLFDNDNEDRDIVKEILYKLEPL
ncbi:hypothetical protein LTR35_000051 [Friedmanniomyces endolithicus]|uniref:Peptidase S8/S53 domain-containing protein n=1 Tax=Friedmanniomyces endolithicus TaxID=329885 RepID=A0AAN6FKV0_9PEZI|nr:hypothetical protein LTS00_008696 [Friedmanniomyces endolithicus]KAK0293447.1 hypothetical protein LTR35_000051 [Friedmanniomyces endolithicus]KAK0318977.1 hypothetical protein LTR82_010077 [Friedmanniomyces endolithicus]KAK0997411.1 hypothetical protein LTR54_009871 [Friedmanniomyces endolithicus]